MDTVRCSSRLLGRWVVCPGRISARLELHCVHQAARHHWQNDKCWWCWGMIHKVGIPLVTITVASMAPSPESSSKTTSFGQFTVESDVFWDWHCCAIFGSCWSFICSLVPDFSLLGEGWGISPFCWAFDITGCWIMSIHVLAHKHWLGLSLRPSMQLPNRGQRDSALLNESCQLGLLFIFN